MRIALAIPISILLPLAFCASSTPARAEWLRVLPGAVVRVAAAGKNVAVVRGQQVLVLREDGQEVSRLGGRALVSDEKSGASFESIAEQTLDWLEIPEIDRGTDRTDDLVENEIRLGDRRAARSRRRIGIETSPLPRPALAANATEIWIAHERGLFRVAETGAIEQAFGREWTGSALVTANRRIVVDQGNTLALLSTTQSTTQSTTLDEPRTLRTSGPVSHLALSADGRRLAWASGAGVPAAGIPDIHIIHVIHVMNAAGSTRVEAPDAIIDLTFFHDTLLAVLGQGILAIPPEGRAEMRPAPAHLHRVFCPLGPGSPWLALGNGLWMSLDQSQHWTSVPVPMRPVLHDVAVSDHHVWLATADGLYMSVDTPVNPDPQGVAETASLTYAPRPTWLTWLLPKVSVRAAATVASARQQWEGFAFAAFPLGQPALPIAGSPWAEAPATLGPGPPERGSAAGAERGLAFPIDAADGDAECLALARRKAIEVALSEPERARSYVNRARYAAWLPELRLLVSRRYGRSESLDIDSSSTSLSSPLGIDTVNDLRYEARATWDLGRLVLSSDELAAQTQALHMAESRREIESTMNRLYFERRRLVGSPTADRAEAHTRALRVQELQAELDAMSSGTFGACVSDKSAGAR